MCFCVLDIHGMEPWLLREALKVLEGEGRCVGCGSLPGVLAAHGRCCCAMQAAVIAGETCEEDGVKFLATE